MNESDDRLGSLLRDALRAEGDDNLVGADDLATLSGQFCLSRVANRFAVSLRAIQPKQDPQQGRTPPNT